MVYVIIVWEGYFRKNYALSVGSGLGCLYFRHGSTAKHDRTGLRLRPDAKSEIYAGRRFVSEIRDRSGAVLEKVQ